MWVPVPLRPSCNATGKTPVDNPDYLRNGFDSADG